MKLNWSNMKGKRFGLLKVLGKADSGRVLCKCKCGKRHEVASHNLKGGLTKSCGCLREARNLRKDITTTHGMTGTRIYNTWNTMTKRGAYTQRWKSFEAFYADMGDAPKNHNLKRRDDTKPFSKKNCFWDIRGPLTFRKKRIFNPDDSRLNKMGVTIVRSRLNNGYTVEQAVTIPKRMHRKKWLRSE